MPEDYLRCIKEGGRVRSKRLNKDEYLPICYKDGKSYAGEKKKYKRLSKNK